MSYGKGMVRGQWRFNVLISLALLLCLWSGCSTVESVQSQRIGDDIVRFYDKGVTVGQLPPSMSLVKPRRSLGKASASWPVIPEYSISDDGRQTVRINIEEGTSLYGTGEVIGPLLRNGTVVECWNTDAYGYNESTKSLYQSHPWVLAVRKDGSAFGVLADTTYRCRIDLTEEIEFAADGPSFPTIIIEGDSPQAVLKKLTNLIGKIQMPPRWALGYHQCRYSYFPDSRVLEVANGFRSRNIPCDVIWMDIDYMDKFKIFTFDPKGFPDPTGLNNDLHDLGFKSVWMIDPGVGAEKGYFVYDQGKAGNHFVKKADGTEYNGEVWPGMCAFPDFTRPATRNWWAGLYKDFMATGVDGVWNDMCEPAVFNVPSKTMPEDNLHAGGGGLPAAPHAMYHNVYGMLMVKASRKGIQAANPDKRPFVLTRANFIGGHRYAATWTGDNTASWEHLDHSVSMVLNLGLSGQPFSGPDIGGFVGDGDPQLFAHWMGVGAFFPFSRGHTAKDTRNKEPWSFGKEVEDVCRTSLQRRYRLMPYLYTLFHASSLDGLPVARPVFFADADDPALRAEDDAFLLGSDLLVIPKLSQGIQEPCAEPDGIWRTMTLVGEDHDSQEQLPELKIRGGAIIPLGKVVQHTGENSLEILTLVVCLDEKGRAKGTLYEDAGQGYGYRQGQYLLTEYTARRQGDKVIVKVGRRQGELSPSERNLRVEIITEEGVVKADGQDGDKIVVDL